MMIDMFVNVYLPRFFDWVIETSIMDDINCTAFIAMFNREFLQHLFSLSYSNGPPVIFDQYSVDRIQKSTDTGDTKVITNKDTYISGSTQTHNNEKNGDKTFSFWGAATSLSS